MRYTIYLVLLAEGAWSANARYGNSSQPALSPLHIPTTTSTYVRQRSFVQDIVVQTRSAMSSEGYAVNGGDVEPTTMVEGRIYTTTTMEEEGTTLSSLRMVASESTPVKLVEDTASAISDQQSSKYVTWTIPVAQKSSTHLVVAETTTVTETSATGNDGVGVDSTSLSMEEMAGTTAKPFVSEASFEAELVVQSSKANRNVEGASSLATTPATENFQAPSTSSLDAGIGTTTPFPSSPGEATDTTNSSSLASEPIRVIPKLFSASTKTSPLPVSTAEINTTMSIAATNDQVLTFTLAPSSSSPSSTPPISSTQSSLLNFTALFSPSTLHNPSSQSSFSVSPLEISELQDVNSYLDFVSAKLKISRLHVWDILCDERLRIEEMKELSEESFEIVRLGCLEKRVVGEMVAEFTSNATNISQSNAGSATITASTKFPALVVIANSTTFFEASLSSALAQSTGASALSLSTSEKENGGNTTIISGAFTIAFLETDNITSTSSGLLTPKTSADFPETASNSSRTALLTTIITLTASSEDGNTTITDNNLTSGTIGSLNCTSVIESAKSFDASRGSATSAVFTSADGQGDSRNATRVTITTPLKSDNDDTISPATSSTLVEIPGNFSTTTFVTTLSSLTTSSVEHGISTTADSVLSTGTLKSSNIASLTESLNTSVGMLSTGTFSIPSSNTAMNGDANTTTSRSSDLLPSEWHSSSSLIEFFTFSESVNNASSDSITSLSTTGTHTKSIFESTRTSSFTTSSSSATATSCTDDLDYFTMTEKNLEESGAYLWYASWTQSEAGHFGDKGEIRHFGQKWLKDGGYNCGLEYGGCSRRPSCNEILRLYPNDVEQARRVYFVTELQNTINLVLKTYYDSLQAAHVNIGNMADALMSSSTQQISADAAAVCSFIKKSYNNLYQMALSMRQPRLAAFWQHPVWTQEPGPDSPSPKWLHFKIQNQDGVKWIKQYADMVGGWYFGQLNGQMAASKKFCDGLGMVDISVPGAVQKLRGALVSMTMMYRKEMSGNVRDLNAGKFFKDGDPSTMASLLAMGMWTEDQNVTNVLTNPYELEELMTKNIKEGMLAASYVKNKCYMKCTTHAHAALLCEGYNDWEFSAKRRFEDGHPGDKNHSPGSKLAELEKTMRICPRPDKVCQVECWSQEKKGWTMPLHGISKLSSDPIDVDIKQAMAEMYEYYKVNGNRNPHDEFDPGNNFVDHLDGNAVKPPPFWLPVCDSDQGYAHIVDFGQQRHDKWSFGHLSRSLDRRSFPISCGNYRSDQTEEFMNAMGLTNFKARDVKWSMNDFFKNYAPLNAAVLIDAPLDNFLAFCALGIQYPQMDTQNVKHGENSIRRERSQFCVDVEEETKDMPWYLANSHFCSKSEAARKLFEVQGVSGAIAGLHKVKNHRQLCKQWISTEQGKWLRGADEVDGNYGKNAIKDSKGIHGTRWNGAEIVEGKEILRFALDHRGEAATGTDDSNIRSKYKDGLSKGLWDETDKKESGKFLERLEGLWRSRKGDEHTQAQAQTEKYQVEEKGFMENNKDKVLKKVKTAWKSLAGAVGSLKKKVDRREPELEIEKDPWRTADWRVAYSAALARRKEGKLRRIKHVRVDVEEARREYDEYLKEYNKLGEDEDVA